MHIDIEKLLKENFKRILSDYELKNSSFLNIVYNSIDDLIKHAREWFGDDVPSEYINILNSLVNLSIVYFDNTKDVLFNIDNDKQEFLPEEVISEIKNDIGFLLNKSIQIDCPDGIILNSSRNVYKESLINIIVCLNQFSLKDHDLYINIKKTKSSTITEIKQKIDSRSAPEVSNLLKLFYSYYFDDQYHFRLGLEIPFSNIKKIGGKASVEITNSGELRVTIGFISNEILRMIDDIRNNNKVEKKINSKENISISLKDEMLERVLKDTLEDYGYGIEIKDPKKFGLKDDYNKILVIDYSLYSELLSNNDHGKLYSSVIVICDSSEEIEISDSVKILKKPFEIQELFELIDRN